MIESLIFWFFAALMLIFGAGVVLFRSPVSSALSLVMSFVALAALFVTLDAFFIAVIQVLVYAGAVMVLFLFIIMLLDLRAGEWRRLNLATLGGAGLVMLGFVAVLVKTIHSDPAFHSAKPPLADPGLSDVSSVGTTLFSSFNMPFQVIGVLLLVATVGVVFLSKRELR